MLSSTGIFDKSIFYVAQIQLILHRVAIDIHFQDIFLLVFDFLTSIYYLISFGAM